MTSTERQAVLSLALIMSLRMIGLFMVLPAFTLYASQLQSATPLLIGLATGIYGLAQALCQIPLGALSDRIGRKPIIFFGLVIFALGSFIAGISHSIFGMLIGRTLQGVGAIGSTILATISDLTREEERTKAMAMTGMIIGLSFVLAMLLGPLLTAWLAINQLFFVALALSGLAMFILFFMTPTPSITRWHGDTEPEWHAFLQLLTFFPLTTLNMGIMILHVVFTASFVVLPISLYRLTGFSPSQQWMIYSPALIIALMMTFLVIHHAEKNNQVKLFFLFSIIMLALSECLLLFLPTHLAFAFLGLCLFFTGFATLEAFLPSLISRTAPSERKGTALGIYSCSQFLGIFLGGSAGGWLYGKYSFSSVYFFCIILLLFWFVFAYRMKPSHHLIT